MTHSDTTISILTHSAIREAKRCLSAVLESRGGATLVLTANGNPEAAHYFEHLAMAHENVEVIVNRENLGFIEPNNLAFDQCSTEYFVTLNDDAVPPPNWLDKLKACFVDDKVVIAGPGDRWLDRNFVGHRYRGGDLPEPDYIEGSCMMVRVPTLRSHQEPLFWRDLRFAYCDDAELCLRMRSLGYTIAKADFVLEHRAGTTTRTVPGLHDIMRQNFWLCEQKWRRYLKTRSFA